MNLKQKIQYKARAYLYQWEQKKQSKASYENSSSLLDEILEGLDQIEGYLDEKIEMYKDKTNKPY